MMSCEFKHLELGLCRHGLMLWPKLDETIGKALKFYGEFAESENILMSRYLNKGDVVIDVGANLGTTVLPLSRCVGEEGRVWAYEPQPLMAQCLHATLTLNEIFNVNLLTAAAGASMGWGHIPAKKVSDKGNYGGVRLSNCGEKVPIFTIDDLEIKSCALVKIDVEGHEWQVLEGGVGYLLKYKPVIYMEAFPSENTVLSLDWLMANGWTCFWHFAKFFRDHNFKMNDDNVFGSLGDLNVLAVRNPEQFPKDLPQVEHADENWQIRFEKFYGL